MVRQLFRHVSPRPGSRLLDPGCGDGAFITGILRWCRAGNVPLPRIVGVESDALLASAARRLFARHPTIEIITGDFLATDPVGYDFVIGNPPYVPITGISGAEKENYRNRYETASGRFDLYLLFFEQALRFLRRGGRLVFITPEKFLYVESARPLRRLLARQRVEEIRLVDERTFGDLVTYPTITTVVNTQGVHKTRIIGRDGRAVRIALSHDGSSWLPLANGKTAVKSALTLDDICLRISCGVATGADGVFVRRTRDLDRELLDFAYPTVAGRDLTLGVPAFRNEHSMLVPYARSGELLEEARLGALKAYLEHPTRRASLLKRTCVRRKPWYAFHETPPLPHILRPKLLCKDIAARPQFWVNSQGDLVPRHSVYYIVPKNSAAVDALCEYLNSSLVEEWLAAHCQRAANSFIRLQSHILKQLPIPASLAALVGSAPPEEGEGETASTVRRASQLRLPLRRSLN